MSTKINVRFDFGFVPGKKYNPLIVITQFEEKEDGDRFMGEITFQADGLDYFIANLKALKHHPNLWDTDEENDS